MEKQKLKRITMNVVHTNPDARVTFTAVGAGKTEKEAVVFGLGVFYKVMSGNEEDQPIEKYEEALEFVNDHLEYENPDEVINSLIAGTIEKNSDVFFNAYESTEVEYNWDETEDNKEGGYISKMIVLEQEY